MTVSAVLPVENCEALFQALGVTAGVSGAFTSYLFNLRVQAVYLRSRYVTILFTFLWVVEQAVGVLADTALRA
ncbi:hypothetical protein HWV62_38414, partial [Athelia sp. TMB]